MKRSVPALPLLAAELFGFFIAAAAPSPLLVPFGRQFGFGAAMLTIIFAIYAIALLGALLTAGGLSDHVGRKPIIVGALLLETVSMLVFLAASATVWLLLARAIQGFATGIAVGALNAAIVEAARSRAGGLINGFAPLSGLAVGGLLSGWLIQQVADPAELIFSALAAFFAIAAGLTVLIPETSTMRPGAWPSLKPRLSIPAAARRTFLALTPGLIALWALGGLYLSLIPPAMGSVYGVHAALAGGLAIGMLNATGAIAPLVLARLQPQTVTVIGSAAIALGSLLIAASVVTTSIVLFFVGTFVAGIGFGSAFSASPRQLAAFVTASTRAQMFASIYVVSYAAFSIPAVLAGTFVQPFGLTSTLLVFALSLVVVALLGTATSLAERRAARTKMPDLGVGLRDSAHNSITAK
ncbi:MFS transporter [Antrihabitans stalactiti]|uniref:MFS transporter n=1 Tax=Antrihabitans stalactiti TaxID=2584121 RepID=UPI001469F5D2